MKALLLVSYVLIGVIAGNRGVLCVGESGHIALEAAGQVCSSQAAHEGRSTSLVHSDCEEVCGSKCTDIPLSSVQVVKSDTDGSAKLVQISSLLPYVLPQASSDTSYCRQCLVGGNPLAGNASNAALRTVVLLV